MYTPIRSLAALASVALVAVSVPQHLVAQEFSADIVRTPTRGSETSRVYVGSSKLRLENLENGKPANGAIWDFNTQALTLVLDTQHAYIGGSKTSLVSQMMAKSGAPPIWRLFRPSTSADPCATWNAVIQAIAARDSTPAGHASCSSLGSDVVGGRPAQKWAVTMTDAKGKSDHGTIWIDSRLHVVSKSQDSTGTMQLANIQEGTQPASVFTVPASYHPLDLRQMMGARFGSDSAVAAALANAAKDIADSATSSTASAAKTQATNSVTKKLKGILRLP